MSPIIDAETSQAWDTVAAHLVARLVEAHAGSEWESYPEIGEDDWISIAGRAQLLAAFPPEDQYRAAYVFLERRCGIGDAS